jgi:hypothetical protein
MQQIERKYLRNLSMQPAKKKQVTADVFNGKGDAYRLQYEDLKKNVIRKEFNEIMKKNKRPQSNSKKLV